ncbi:MAG: hypothetical protein HZB13_03055 [Acidobacteria bacterium]|nr:hypothetical protein [Acidobacteriota bacterium]
MQLARPGFWMLVAVLALAGGFAGGVAAWTMPERYMAVGIAGIRDGAAGNRGFTDRIQRSFQAALRSEALQEIIERHDLYRTERNRQPLEQVISRMKRDIWIAAASPRRAAFSISFTCPDRAKARAVTQDLLELTVAEDGKLQPGGTAARLEVWENPGLPEAPISPNRTVVLSAGLLGGAILGVVIGGIRRVVERGRQKRGAGGLPAPREVGNG